MEPLVWGVESPVAALYAMKPHSPIHSLPEIAILDRHQLPE